MRRRVLSMVLAIALAFPSTSMSVYASGNEPTDNTYEVTVDGSTEVIIESDLPSTETQEVDASEEEITSKEELSSAIQSTEASTETEELSSIDASTEQETTDETFKEELTLEESQKEEVSSMEGIDENEGKEEVTETQEEEHTHEEEEFFTTCDEPWLTYEQYYEWLNPLSVTRSNIIITTPDTWYNSAAYDGVDLYPDGSFVGNGKTSEIPLHFHYGSDGNIAFCMGVNLKNPDNQTSYTIADLSSAYGSKLDKVSAIVQNSVLQFNSNKTSNTLPTQWKNLTFVEVQYTAQLAIWYTLMGTPGNEPVASNVTFNDAWLYKNIYFPRMKNWPGTNKDIKGFFDYLVSDTTTIKEPTASLQVQSSNVNGNMFQVSLKVVTTDANAGTNIDFVDLPTGSRLKDSNGSVVTLYGNGTTSTARFSGDVSGTFMLEIPTASNSGKIVFATVYANTNATTSNLVWLTPSASNYQNLVKVEPTKVKDFQTQARITLPKASGSLTLKKVDSRDAAITLSGATFGIYSDAACTIEVTRVTTGTNGTISVSLDHGTYYVKEISAPNNYQLNNTVYTVNISATATTQTVTNDINRYTIHLTKKDQDTGALLQGAVFGVYSNAACTTEVGTITTGANGTGTLGNLPYGTYYLKEKTAPTNYVLNTNVYTVTTTGNHGTTVYVEATNVRKTNYFLIEKVDDYDATIKLQAEFGIYMDAACNNKVGSITTGSDGIGKSPVLRYGTYYIKETKVPEGYKDNNTVYTVQVNDNSHNNANKIVIKNAVKLYTLELYKTDVDVPNMKLSGAIFNVYSDPACTNRVGTFPATDANGYTKLEKVRYGTYYIKEVTAPKDYILSNQVYKVTTPDQNGAVIRIDATNKRKEGNLQIRKKDSTTGANILGAIYGIYSDAACNNKVAEFPATDSNGYAKSPSLRYGVYYVKEQKAPTGFVINNQVYTVEVSDASPTTVYDVNNKPQLGTITVNKTGEVLTGYANGQFTYEQRPLAGVVFEIYAKEDIKNSSGVIVYKKDTVVDTITTAANGTVTSKALPLGNYYVKEKQAVNGYFNDGTTKDVTLSYGGQNIEVVNAATNKSNPLQNVSISLLKQDKDTKNPLQGATFGIYATADIKNVDGAVIVTKGTLLEEVTTNGNGNATFTKDYPFGTYQVKELSTRPGYILNTEVWNITFDYSNQNEQTRTFTKTFTNERMSASIQLTKVDSETGIAQADATLEGAIYGLYAREDIQKPDGTGVLYAKGTKVAELKTDKDGKASIDNLYLGKYFVKEIKPSTGYLLDTTEYDIDATYTQSNTAASNIAIISKEVEVKEDIIKRPFQIIKVSHDEASEDTLLQGAGFSVYLKSTLVYLADGTIDYENSPKTVIGQNGETELFTDNKGYLQTIAIPYGTYVVSETTVPDEHFKANDFEVTIAEKDTIINQDGISIGNIATPQDWNLITDKKFNALLKIIKLDEETGREILMAGTQFKIFNLNKNEYVVQTTIQNGEKVNMDVFTTSDKGYLITPELLPVGRYRIEEVQAVDGYYNDGHTAEVEISMGYTFEGNGRDDFYDTDLKAYILPMKFTNPLVKGEIEVHKTGEVLVGVKEKEEGNFFTKAWDKISSLFANKKEKLSDTKYEFVYEEVPLKDAVYNIVVAEDIYSYDNQTDENGNRIIYTDETGLSYKAGTIVDTITTDENGYAKSKLLPLGKYEIVEIDAPEGFLDTDFVHTALLEYGGQTVSIVGDTDGDAENHFYNDRIVTVPTPPTDTPNNPENPENPDTPDVDDPNHPQNPSQPPYSEEGTAIIGIGMKKYSKNEDGTTNYEKPLSGTTFGLYNRYDIVDVNGNVLIPADTLLSTATTKEDGLAVFEGDFPTNIYMTGSGTDITKPEESQYYAIEFSVTDGYLLDQTPIDGLFFYYRDETMNKYVVVQREQDNDYTKVEILKVSDVNGIKEPLPGAVLSIYKWDTEKEETVGEAIETWTSTLEPHRINTLPAGDYVLMEEQTPEGYQKANPIVFTVENIKGVQKIAMEDTKTYGKFIIIKKEVDVNGNESNLYPVEGTKFRLQYADSFRGEDGFSVYEKGQAILDENGEEIILTIGEDGTATSPILPVYVYGLDGAYMEIPYEVVEIEASYGHTLMEEPIPVVFTYVNDETSLVTTEIVVENPVQKGRIAVEKLGEKVSNVEKVETNFGVASTLQYKLEPLGGVEFTIYSDVECTQEVMKVTTDEDGYAYSDYLAVGKYYVRETHTLQGYILDDIIYEFDIKGDRTGNEFVSDVTKEIVNYLVKGVLNIKKVDGEGNTLEGVEFTLTNNQTEDAYTVTTDKEGMATIKNLPVGYYNEEKKWNFYVYTLEETKGLDGYEMATEEKQIVFELEDGEKEAVVSIEIVNNKVIVPPTPFVPILGIENHRGVIGLTLLVTASICIAILIAIKIRKIHK